MRAVLLIDFGSTYTKLAAVDLEAEALLGVAAARTTAETDVGEGLAEARRLLEERTGPLACEAAYACSSAAGGLRMVASGLVPELTGEAARLASLGAGAKVAGVYAFQLTEEDGEAIRAAKPDIFLLAGGTDGGNTECILHNAGVLSRLRPDFPVIIAGNRSAAGECRRLLEGFEVYVCPNVMPKFGVLNIEPAQERIREIFLKRIVRAKGLSRAAGLLSDILMPTPSAVLLAVELLARGCEGEPGIGELVAVDVGGATTDVYSIAGGAPERANTVCKGLPEPYAKRTVEGDIGMRYSAQGVLEAAGLPRVSALAGLTEERTAELAEELRAHAGVLPAPGGELERLDFALASCAVEEAVRRHAGTIKEAYTMMGQTFVQEGKDLTGVGQVVVTGGSLIHTPRVGEIAARALYDPAQPCSLRPREAGIWVDRSYILSAMGLLSSRYPETALRIMKKELSYHGHSK